MNLLYITHYPKSCATKPFQCQALTIYYSNYLQIAMFVHQNAVSCCRFR
ncbi:hypothetical protein [Wolbachia pipientis]